MPFPSDMQASTFQSLLSHMYVRDRKHDSALFFRNFPFDAVIEREHGGPKDYGKFSFQSMIRNVLRVENSSYYNFDQTERTVTRQLCPKPLKREFLFDSVALVQSVTHICTFRA